MNSKIEGVLISPTKIIQTRGGNVMHGLKHSDNGYNGFGEAYFSIIHGGEIKGWKRHQNMTMNILVPVGSVRFVLYDDRNGSKTNGCFLNTTISEKNYNRITVPPKIWFGFQGIGEKGGVLLNIANILHDPKEIERINLNQIPFDW